MSFAVAKEYRIRPLEVYTKWESTELLIAFGIMMNDSSKEAWANWVSQQNPDKKPTEPESEYAVPFRSLEMVRFEKITEKD